LLAEGDASHHPHWEPVSKVKAWLADNPEQVSWDDLAGIQYYVRTMCGGIRS